MQNFTFVSWYINYIKRGLLGAFLLIGFFAQSQIGTQSPSIRTGVTFQWDDTQNGNNNNPATIKSLTIDGSLYNSFVVPSGYELTRLGPAGNGTNNIWLNGAETIGTSATSTGGPTSPWNSKALAAFQSRNLNHYFEASSPQGDNICLNFNAANGMNGVPETNAQLQTLSYNPPIPSNAGGVLAVTERGGNNCLYVRFFGIPAGGGPEQSLGDTFIRTSGNLTGGGFSAPASGSDYWGSGREQDNGQTIAIGLFRLDNVAPVGSRITRIRFLGASNDHGDGKFFILQRYAQPQMEMGCINGTLNGQIDNSTSVPAGSTYTLVSGPTPAGVSFTLNPDGSFQYVPQPGFVGEVNFTYKVRLPAPNQHITDTSTVTLTYNENPIDPEIEVSCNSDGSYNLEVTNPTGTNYEYQINEGPYQSSVDFNDLGPGTYTIGLRDLSTGCENKPSSTTVTLEELMGMLDAKNDVVCFGDDDGSIAISVTGGFPPYSYVWSNGDTTQDISDLTPGTYNVQIFDTSGCMFEFLEDIIIEGPNSGIAVTESITDVLCFGEATGSIDLTVSGGTPPYTYSWSNGATTQDISGLAAGDYSVTVLDSNQCLYEEIFTIIQPSSGIQLSTELIDVSCFGNSTASIDLMVSGGVPPYTYNWTNGATSQDLINIPAGNYNVIVTDENGCTATLPAPVEITQPEPIVIELTKTNASATGLCQDGTATATVTGGTPPYTYQWDDPNNQTTATATGLSASPLGGTQYTVVVTDANGCTEEQSVIITCVQNCDAVISVTNVTDVLCKGEDTGSATVSASSNANPGATFTFTWNTTPQQVDAGVTSSTISSQFAGVYTVSVTIDGTLCQAVEESVTISEPSTELSVTATATDETGPTTNDGTATANASGGIPPYTYLWSPGGQTTQTINGLSDGTYTVTVTDANGCSATTTVTVNDGDCRNLSATASSTPISCNGGNDGTATVNVSGGLGAYTYSWSPGGQTTQSIANLSAGTYNITVTDTATLCTVTSSTTVGEPTNLTSGIAVTNVECFGENTGSLDLTVGGGTTPYTYVWSNGATTQDISNLIAGTYSVVITDANGCVLNDEATVGQPSEELSIEIDTQVNIVCDESLGLVVVEAMGGTPPYTYSLDGGAPQSSNTFGDLEAGTYEITVTDANGCSTSVPVFIINSCIAIVKTGTVVDTDGNGCTDVGETIAYTFIVTNRGNVPISTVTVTDPLLGAINFNSGDTDGDGELDVQEAWEYTATYTITQEDIDAGQVTNQATASGTASDSVVNDLSDNSSVLEDDPTVTPLCQSAVIALVKEADVTLDPTDNCYDVAVGGTIAYNFMVTNEGTVSLDNIVLTDALVANAAYVSGDDGDNILQVDETWLYTGTYTVTQADIDAGQVENTATVTGDDTNDVQVSDISGATINDDNQTVTPLCHNAVIALVKEADVTLDPTDNCYDVAVGGTIAYNFMVTNEGTVSLDNIVLTDALVANAAYVSGDDGDNILQVDETWLYTGTYTVTQADIDAGQVVNTATVTGDDTNDVQVSDISGATINDDNQTVTPLCHSAVIALVKEADVTLDPTDNCYEVAVGGTIAYNFMVTNEGTVSLDNILLTDALVANAAYVSGDDGDNILQVDETWLYTGTYTVTQADIDAGQVVNTATVTGDDTNDVQVSDISGATINDDNQTVTTICNSAGIALIKVGTYDGFDQAGNCTADVGDTITYAFTVTNTGNVTLTNVVVTDPLVTMAGGPIASLAPGASDSTTFTASYAVTQADIDAGQFTNQATATGTPPSGPNVTDLSDDNSNTENDPTVTTICQSPVIAIVKEASYDDGGDCSQPGEMIDYTFTVTNEGNVSLSNITVTDPLLEAPNPVVPIVFAGGDTDGDNELDVDETWTYTASYVITQDDIDAGEVNNQATATGTAPDGTVVDDLSGSTISVDEITTTTLCQSPSIAIVKEASYDDGGDCSQPGEMIDYTFTVTNEGNVSLSNITVTDPLLDAPNPVVPIVFAGGDTDGDNELDVDETWTYTASYVITQDDIDAGEVNNQATATGTAPDGTVVDDLSGSTISVDEITTTTLCQSPSIAIVKTAAYDDGGDCSQPGEMIDYTFTVTNEGNVSLSNITVTDPLLEAPNPVVPIVFAGGDTDGDNELDVDETWTYTASYVITQDDIDAGEVNNQATATGTAPDGTVVDDLSGSTISVDEITTTTLCQSPSIAIVKEASYDDGGDCSQPGEMIDYTFTVTNEGNVSLSNITVTDPLLDAPNPVVPIVFAGGDTDGDNELDVDETWTYTASYVITQDDIDAGEVNNQATATGTAPDGTVVDDLSGSTISVDEITTTTLCQSPSIAIVKTAAYDDGGDCSQPGEMIDYTFTVTNEGNVSLSNITVTDPLLEAPNPVVPIVFAGGDTDGDNELDVDETWTYTASYVITQDDIDAGEVNNQATATGTAPDGTVVDDLSGSTISVDEITTTTLCQSPSIAIVKEASYDDGGDCSQPGEMIDYTFTVTNEGNVSLSNITVTDPLLDAPNPVVPIVFAGGDTDGDNELDVDETWTYTASYVITQDDIDAGEVNNQATATGTAPDGTVVDDLSGSTISVDEITTTTLCQSPSIAIVKTAAYDDGGDCSQPGEMIDYTFTVTNEGNVSLSNITVTDPLLEAPNPVVPIVFAGGDTDGDNELDVDETWTYTASYVITQDDIDAGEVNNQATATGTAPDGTVVDDLSGSTISVDEITTTTLCQSPSIAIVKEASYDDGGDCSQPGEMIDYTFTVTNEGNVSLTDVVVNDPLLGGNVPGPDSGDIDGDNELDVTETWIYTGSYAITQADIDAGEVTNQATATGFAPDQSAVSDLSGSTTTTDDTTVTALCQSPAIAIVKEASYDDGGDCSQPGEMIDYTFTVTNEGNVSLSNITVTDPLLEAPNPVVPIVFAGGDVDGDSELDVDEIWTYTASYTITQIDIDAGEVNNQATATGTAPDGTVVDDLSGDTISTDTITTTTLCFEPSIALIKRGTLNDENGNGCTDPGETISYAFEVRNTGNISLSAVTIDDPAVNVVGGPIVLAPGEEDTATFTAVYSITQADIDNGSFENQAIAMGTAPNGTVVEDDSDFDVYTDDRPTVTALCQNASIALIKEGTVMDENGSGCADPKETIEYRFTVRNTGNVTLTNVDIEDPLVNVLGGPITLAPGETDASSFGATYLITQANINDGFVENQATVSGTDPNGAVVDDESDFDVFTEDRPTITELCQNASIALIKTGEPQDQNGNGCVDLGESIIYEFVVKNTGNVVLTDIIITDPLVAVTGGPITLDPDDSDSDTFRAEYFVTQEDVDAGFVINQAFAEGTAPDGTIVSDLSDNDSFIGMDPTELGLCQDPRVSLEKSGVFNDDNGDGIPQPGETISYVFSVENTGNVRLFNLVLEDELEGIEIEGGPIAVLEVGEIDDTTFTATYAITQDDIDAGEVVNQAVITGETSNGTVVEDTSDDPNDLTNTDIDGDGDPDDPTVIILPNVLPAPADFEIFNGITPDGDGLNDFFRVLGIENFPDNNMKIFNRWGVLVFETDGYGGASGEDNVFRGFSNGRATIRDGEILPTGTYFYILVRQDPNSGETLKNSGYLYINR